MEAVTTVEPVEPVLVVVAWVVFAMPLATAQASPHALAVLMTAVVWVVSFLAASVWVPWIARALVSLALLMRAVRPALAQLPSLGPSSLAQQHLTLHSRFT